MSTDPKQIAEDYIAGMTHAAMAAEDGPEQAIASAREFVAEHYTPDSRAARYEQAMLDAVEANVALIRAKDAMVRNT